MGESRIVNGNKLCKFGEDEFGVLHPVASRILASSMKIHKPVSNGLQWRRREIAIVNGSNHLAPGSNIGTSFQPFVLVLHSLWFFYIL
jgi:hypothetical protein